MALCPDCITIKFKWEDGLKMRLDHCLGKGRMGDCTCFCANIDDEQPWMGSED